LTFDAKALESLALGVNGERALKALTARHQGSGAHAQAARVPLERAR